MPMPNGTTRRPRRPQPGHCPPGDAAPSPPLALCIVAFWAVVVVAGLVAPLACPGVAALPVTIASHFLNAP
jgi:hypothetical protein